MHAQQPLPMLNASGKNLSSIADGEAKRQVAGKCSVSASASTAASDLASCSSRCLTFVLSLTPARAMIKSMRALCLSSTGHYDKKPFIRCREDVGIHAAVCLRQRSQIGA